MRIQTGKKVKNHGNIKKFAWWCGIDNPLQHSVKYLVELYKRCKVSTKKLMAESPWMRKKFLLSQLQEAMKDERVDEATTLKEILRDEAQKKVWAFIHWELRQTRSPSPTRVKFP